MADLDGFGAIIDGKNKGRCRRLQSLEEVGPVMTAEDPDELAQMLQGAPKDKDVIDARLSTWLRLLRDRPELGFTMADRPESPDDVLACLALVGDRRTRSRLVMRNNLPTEVVELLETDPEVGAAAHGVHAPDVDRKKLERFISHRWPSIRAAAEARLSTFEELESDG